MIEVDAAGRRYQEMNVDGGAVAQTFLYPPDTGLRVDLRSAEHARQRHAYIVRNGRLDPDSGQGQNRRFLKIVGRAISTMIHYSGYNDILRIYATTKRDGIDYNLAYIEPDFPDMKHEEFDPAYLRALFDYGYAKGRQGSAWHKAPPSLGNNACIVCAQYPPQSHRMALQFVRRSKLSIDGATPVSGRAVLAKRETAMRALVAAAVLISGLAAVCVCAAAGTRRSAGRDGEAAERKPIAKTVILSGASRRSTASKFVRASRATSKRCCSRKARWSRRAQPLYRIEKALFQAAVDQAEGALAASKAKKLLTAIQYERAEELMRRAAPERSSRATRH